MVRERDTAIRVEIRRSIRSVPRDIRIAVTWLCLSTPVLVLRIGDVAVTAVLSLPLLFLIPGYSVSTAVFPPGRAEDGSAPGGSVSATELIAISFGTSVCILVGVGLVVPLLGVGLELIPVVSTLLLVTAVALAAGWVRRSPGPEYGGPSVTRRALRFVEPRRGDEPVTDGTTRTAWGLALAVTLVLVIALTAGLLGYGLLVPHADGSDTGFAVLTETRTGELVAGNYPDSMTAGDAERLVFAVENSGRERSRYTIVVQPQNVTRTDDTTRVVDVDPMRTYRESVRNAEHDDRFGAAMETYYRNYFPRCDFASNPIARSQAGTRVSLADSAFISAVTDIPLSDRVGSVPFTGGKIPAGTAHPKLELVRRMNSGLDEIDYERTRLPPKRPLWQHATSFVVATSLERLRERTLGDVFTYGGRSMVGEWYRTNDRFRDLIDSLLDSAAERPYFDADVVKEVRSDTRAASPERIGEISGIVTGDQWIRTHLD